MGFRYCLKCQGKINPISNNIICTKCKNQDYIDKNKDRLMKCKICGKEMISLQNHIIKTHKMEINEYKEKYNVDRVHIYSRESKEKMHKAFVGIKRKTPIWNKGLTALTDIRVKKMTENQIGKAPWNKGLNKKIDPRLDYERPTTWKKGQIPHHKGLTKETSVSLKKMSEKLKITFANNPKLHINYKLAQIKHKKSRFGGEQRFEWCLNQVGLKEGIDYAYNKNVKCYDKQNKKYRWFYPDFLLWGKYYFEIDGPHHNTKEAKEYDEERKMILHHNGFTLLGRYAHDWLLKNENLHHTINDLIFVKENWS